MDTFLTVLVIGYWVGVLLAMGVYRERAGLGFFSGRLKILGPTGVGVEWLAIHAVKLFGWPIVLVGWLAMGRPEPRIVFNDKALARQQAQPA